jgi:hypothetical protein
MANTPNIDGGTAAVLQHSREVGPVARETPRWLFFAGDAPRSKRPAYPAGGLDLGSPCVIPPRGKPGYMNRCLITPCVEVLYPLNKQEVPVGVKVAEVIPGRDAFGRVTDTVHVSVYPGEELEVMWRSYRGWGLQEIEALRGKKPEEVAPLKLNSLFFPDWPTLPETNQEVIDHLTARKSFFNKSENKALYHAVADEMIEGVRKVDQWMRNHVDAVHACFLLPIDHEGHRANYDPVDLHFIHRAKLQRRDKDLSTMADTQAAIAQILAGGGQQAAGVTQEQFLESLKMILQQNNEAIKESLERQSYPREKGE